MIGGWPRRGVEARRRGTAARALLCMAALITLASAARSYSCTSDDAAATVNGETITVSEWVARMQKLHYQDFVGPANRPKTMTAGQIALDGLVNARLVMQYAKKVSLLPTDAELDSAMAEAKADPGVTAALKSKAITEAGLREDLRLQRAIFNVATINQSVTRQEVDQFYASHPERYGTPEQWRLAVIRVSSKVAADQVGAELKAGKPFADVAQRLSEDAATRQKGGDLGTVPVTESGIPAFIRDAVSKLKPGETTPQLVSNLGGPAPVYFFIRLLDRTEKKQVPLDQIRPQVERAALFEKVGGGAQKLAEIRRDAKIVVMLPGYEDQFKP